MAFTLGMNAALYVDATKLDNVRDCTLNMTCGESDLTTRGNEGWKATVATLRDASLEFEMVWDSADSGLVSIRDAFLNGETINMTALDEEGGQGLLADWMITNFSRSEPLEEGITVSVTAKIGYSDTAPQWTGGA